MARSRELTWEQVAKEVWRTRVLEKRKGARKIIYLHNKSKSGIRKSEYGIKIINERQLPEGE